MPRKRGGARVMGEGVGDADSHVGPSRSEILKAPQFAVTSCTRAIVEKRSTSVTYATARLEPNWHTYRTMSAIDDACIRKWSQAQAV